MLLNVRSCASAHKHSDSIRTIAPVSFKRMLDGAPCPGVRTRRARLEGRGQPLGYDVDSGQPPVRRKKRGAVAPGAAVGGGARRTRQPAARVRARRLAQTPYKSELTDECYWGGERAA